jgi:hypothetical protein
MASRWRTLRRSGEIAKLVVLVHIDPGLIEDEVGGVEAQRQVERLARVSR